MCSLSRKKYTTSSGASHVVDVSVFLALVCFVVVFVLPQSASAETFLDENFDSYNTGNLETQSDWYSDSDYANVTVYSGNASTTPNSVYYNDPASSWTRYNTELVASTTNAIYFNFDLFSGYTTNSNGVKVLEIGHYQEENYLYRVKLYTTPTVGSQELRFFCRNDDGGIQATAQITDNEWHNIQWKIRCNESAHDEFSYSVDHADFTVVYTSSLGCYGLDDIFIEEGYPKSYNSVLLDNFKITDGIPESSGSVFYGPLYDPNSVYIYIDSPVEGYTFSTTTADFHVTGRTGTTTGFMWVSAREYYDFYDGGRSTSEEFYHSGGNIDNEFSISGLTASTTYYATAIFEDETTGARTLSNTINFNVIATSTIFADEDSGILIGKIVGFYNNLMHRIKYTFPWGYIFLIQDRFSEFNDDAGTLSDMDIVLPMETISTTLGTPSTFPDVTIFSYTWLTEDNSYMADVYDEWILLNKYTSYLLWFLLIFFLWRNTTYKTDRMN